MAVPPLLRNGSVIRAFASNENENELREIKCAETTNHAALHLLLGSTLLCACTQLLLPLLLQRRYGARCVHASEAHARMAEEIFHPKPVKTSKSVCELDGARARKAYTIIIIPVYTHT